jgi:hypothetical protein
MILTPMNFGLASATERKHLSCQTILPNAFILLQPRLHENKDIKRRDKYTDLIRLWNHIAWDQKYKR